jgi:hypothetical protein
MCAPSSFLPNNAVRHRPEEKMTPKLKRAIRNIDLPNHVGLKHTQIEELRKAGEFPKSIPVSDTGRATITYDTDIALWQEYRRAKSEGTTECKTWAEYYEKAKLDGIA